MNPVYLCTLFDKNYIDKGLVLYSSIKKNEEFFVLYILAIDEEVYRMLNDINDERIVLIRLTELEKKYSVLESLKEERTFGELCWTCTSLLIEYVLDVFKISNCTYIDSDLKFYSSPRIMIEEFEASKKDVGLTPHRFPNTINGKKQLQMSGKYCVEFNTFNNNDEGRRLLSIWKNKCLEKCSIKTGGDQLYLTDWGELYDSVYDYCNFGAGVAPWNLKNYKFIKKQNTVFVSDGSEMRAMVFYHFQGIQYSDDGRININVFAHPDAGFVSHRIINYFYKPYLYEIDKVRQLIKTKYNVDLYVDGCGRKYAPVKFDLKKFIKGLLVKIRTESLAAAFELIIRVFRKKEDIIYRK